MIWCLSLRPTDKHTQNSKCQTENYIPINRHIPIISEGNTFILHFVRQHDRLKRTTSPWEEIL